jgi:peptidoglycan lytic transglycosylase
MPKWRRGHLVIGALMLGIGFPAVALAAGQTTTGQSAISVNLSPRHLAFGREVRATGVAPRSEAGRTLLLEFASGRSSSWRALTTTTVRGDGSFRLKARLPHSGLVRVVGTSATQATQPAVGTRGAVSAQTAGTSDVVSSPAQRITVAADLHVRSRNVGVLGAQAVYILGKLRPGVNGRRVVLQGREGGGWRTLTSARTGPNGGFNLRYVPQGLGQEQLRVKFGGDQLNARIRQPAGQVTAFRESLASWYDDGGQTACGFHAYYGVANRDLPCGTQVTFRNGGASVTATVDDRGPFTGGRDWDLNQNTAGALGFGGVGGVWATA